MDNQPALCRHLAWDSEFWGYPVARLDCEILRKETEQTALEWCHRQNIRCLYFSADGTDAETLQRAHAAGFQFVDVRVDLQCDATEQYALAPSNLEIRPVGKEELESLKTIARRAHYDTRFFKDLNFDRLRCERLYEKWIDRDFHEGRVLGFFPDDRVEAGGYVTFSKETEEIVRIGLIAVQEGLRGRGGGRRLLDAAMAEASEMGAKKIRVATQGTNVAALKLYEKAGFRVCDVKICFHKWLDGN